MRYHRPGSQRAAAVFSVTRPGDLVWSNHRCHGHFLAYGGDPYRLAAELMGKATGLVGGRGGGQHIQWKNFHSNGIQGGFTPIAAGMALAEKNARSGSIVLAFLGDGTLGEGALYESLNLAALWQLAGSLRAGRQPHCPNHPARTGSGRFDSRALPGLWHPHVEIDSSDVLEIQPLAREAAEHARQRPAGSAHPAHLPLCRPQQRR